MHERGSLAVSSAFCNLTADGLVEQNDPAAKPSDQLVTTEL